ncbi:hypothetical protein ACFL96_19885 [Thermoproteota archaeon]
MHKKRAVSVTAIVIIILLAMVFVTSDYFYHKNSGTFIDALTVMRDHPDIGFELCGQLTIKEYAKDCYTTYLSVEIENVRAKYPNYSELKGEEKRDTGIKMLNEISEKVEKVCGIQLMAEDSETCINVPAILELQKDQIIAS